MVVVKKRWENHKVDDINRMEARSHFTSLSTIEENKQHFYQNLNGEWSFLYLDAPEYSPEDFYKTDYDYSTWVEIEVPGNWQTQGFGNMHYADLWYNFPIIPPYVPTENPTGIYRRTFEIDNIDKNY